MSGIFDRVNAPGNGSETEPTLAPANVCNAIWLSVTNIRTNAQLLAEINASLNTPLNAESQQDLLDMIGYVEGGTGEAGQVARLQRICIVLAGYETGFSNLTEAEARQATGVTYTFGE